MTPNFVLGTYVGYVLPNPTHDAYIGSPVCFRNEFL